MDFHCRKSVQIWSYLWFEYRKIRTRNNSPYLDTFHTEFSEGNHNEELKTWNHERTENVKK